MLAPRARRPPGQPAGRQRYGSDPALRFDRGFVDQHDGNVVFYRVDAAALRALQALRILPIFKGHFAGWTNQDFEKILRDHDAIVRQILRPTHRGRNVDVARGVSSHAAANHFTRFSHPPG